jgi:rRNA maturation protein Rpf1
MILLTTSRRPTGRIRTLCRDLANSIPDILRINRGKMSLDGVAEKAIELNADRIIMIDRWHGGPGKILLSQILSNNFTAIPPIMLLSGSVLRRDLQGQNRQRCSVITIEPQASSEMQQFAKKISQFIELPIISLVNARDKNRTSMHFSSESSKFRISFMMLNRMVEIGPRIIISKLIWDVA